MSQSNLTVPAAAAIRMCDDIRRYGRAGVETGGLLLTRSGAAEVTVVAVAGTTGIVRRRGLFVIDRSAFDAIFTWTEDNDLQVRAMVHSHAEEAFLSRTDRDGGLRVKGFYSAVVPTFCDPPYDPSLWSWWSFTSDWTPTQAPPSGLTEVAVKTVVFDGDGVRAS